MSTVVANAEKVQVQYVGYFREPVFRVLERPGSLCECLLRHFSVYGADIRSLSINVSVLAEANVACHLSVRGGASMAGPPGGVPLERTRLEVCGRLYRNWMVDDG